MNKIMFHPSGFFHPTPQEATGVSPWRNAGEAAKPEGRSGLPLRRVPPPLCGGASKRCHGRKAVELHWSKVTGLDE